MADDEPISEVVGEKYIEGDIPQNLYSAVFDKDFNIGSIFLIVFIDEDKIIENICEIEAISLESGEISIIGEDLFISQLNIDSEVNIILKTDDYEIIDIELISEIQENELDKIELRLAEDLLGKIVFEDIITNDKIYSDTEKKEEIISNLIALYKAYDNESFIKELTIIGESYITMIREGLKKNLGNKESLNFIEKMINDKKFILPQHIKPIVSTKRILYVTPDEDEEIDPNIIPVNFLEEVISTIETLNREDINELPLKRHHDIDLNNDNYKMNDDNKKFITPYEGEYYRDCLKEESCIGVKVLTEKSIYKTVTRSILQNNYHYSNLRTRKQLLFPNYENENTSFNILKNNEIINLVGLIFFKKNYSWRNLCFNNLFSLNEKSFLLKKSYSYDIFKNILNKANIESRVISNDTRNIDDTINDIVYYLLDEKLEDITIETFASILQENLPKKEDLIFDSLTNDLKGSLYDMNNFERLLHSYDINIGDLENEMKSFIRALISENVNKYLSTYKKLTKYEDKGILKSVKKVLDDEERSKLSLKFIRKIINQKEKNKYLSKYIERFLRRGNKSQGEDYNYLYNEATDKRDLCCHYIYQCDENKFDEMMSVFGGPEVDGHIVCRNCGESLCNSEFSNFQGFSDGAPVQTNEKISEENKTELRALTERQEQMKEVIKTISNVFKIELNENDKKIIFDIIETTDSKDILERRYEIDVLKEHPEMMRLEAENKLKGVKDKKEKERKKLNYKKGVLKFHNYLKESNYAMSIFFLIIFLVQTAIPSYGMKVKYEIIDLDDVNYDKITRQFIKPDILSYFEKIIREYSKKDIENPVWRNLKLVVDEEKNKLGNFYHHLYSTIEVISDNYIIKKRLDKFKEFLSTGEYNVYLKPYWSSYKPQKGPIVTKVNTEINKNKNNEVNSNIENDSLMRPITKEELYKILNIEISEFMNNSSYKSLMKLGFQLHGTSKTNILLLNLLIQRFNETTTKDQTKLFSSLNLKKINFNDFKKIILEDVPKQYMKKDIKSSIDDFLYINQNNPDLFILSVKSNQIPIYTPTNIFPVDDYDILNETKSNILEKIFDLYEKDELGYIQKKTTDKLLNTLLLDLDETDETEKEEVNSFKKTNTNYNLFLEYLTHKSKLFHYSDRHIIYFPFYDNDYIRQSYIENIKALITVSKINKFIKANKYLSYESDICFEDMNKLYDINNDILKLEYLSEKIKQKAIEKSLNELFSSFEDNINIMKEQISESLKIFIDDSDPVQLRRLQTYYGLKISANLAGDKMMKDIKKNTLTERILSSLTNILNLNNNKLKINFIRNIYKKLSVLKNNFSVNPSTSFINILSRDKKIMLNNYIRENENLIHNDIYYNSKLNYEGFKKFEKKSRYFTGLYSYIKDYENLLDNIIGSENKKFFISHDYIKNIINYIFIFILYKITEYISLLSDDESIISQNANILFESLEKDFDDERIKTINECSNLFIDLVQNIIEENEDVGFLHSNKDTNNFKRAMSKQGEREKSFLIKDLTSQTNERRLLTTELQKAGISNWYDSLSKRNAEYKNSSQYALDHEEERIRRMTEMSEAYENEKELFKKNGIDIDSMLAAQLKEEGKEEDGYGDGKDHDYDSEDDIDETDNYDN